jgi:hypothetical protein
MATDAGGSGQRAHEPLLTGLGDALAHGYQALDRVAVGLTESARRVQASTPVRTASGRQRPARMAGSTAARKPRRQTTRQRTTTAPPTIVGEIADLTADMLERLGEAARVVAERILEAEVGQPEAEVARLQLSARPGETRDVDFHFTNTGPIALEWVEFKATKLLGVAKEIKAPVFRVSKQDQDPAHPKCMGRVRARETKTVIVVVAIPEDASPGPYQCVLTASGTPASGPSVDASAFLELQLAPPDTGTE